MGIFTSFSITNNIINISRAKTTSKNFAFISLYKYKNAVPALRCVHIENKNRKKELATTPKNRKRFAIRLKVRTFGSKRMTLAMNRGVIVRLNVINAFTSLYIKILHLLSGCVKRENYSPV
jgi:hypothetical protein